MLWDLGTVELSVHAAVRITLSHEKWPTQGRPSPKAQRYTQAQRTIQPPDDRTYSAEVTSFPSNLPHHRSARAVFPYTRSIMIPPCSPFVKHFFRIIYKKLPAFSSKSQNYFFSFPSFSRHSSFYIIYNVRPACRNGRRVTYYSQCPWGVTSSLSFSVVRSAWSSAPTC